MKYKLTPIRNLKPKSVFYIEIEFMHGDADHTTYETVRCKTEEDFFDKYTILKNRLDYRREYHNAAIDSNNDWCEEHESWLEAPMDVTGGGSWRATPVGIDLFYYNEHGSKFKVTMI